MPEPYRLKVSYRGVNHCITFEASKRYEDIIDMISNCFEFPRKFRGALLITDGNNYIFQKNGFENYILLFPQPKITFYVRIDYDKAAKNEPYTNILASLNLQPLSESQRHNKQPNLDESYEKEICNKDNNNNITEDTCDYIAVPVRRQNCFYGSLPTQDNTLLCDDDNAVDTDFFNPHINETQDFPKPSSKRMHFMKLLATKSPNIKYLKKPKPKNSFRL